MRQEAIGGFWVEDWCGLTYGLKDLFFFVELGLEQGKGGSKVNSEVTSFVVQLRDDAGLDQDVKIEVLRSGQILDIVCILCDICELCLS